MQQDGRTLQALVPANAAGDGPTVVDEAGLTWDASRSVAAFLKLVNEAPARVTLISLGVDGVDGALVRRLAGVVREQSGALLLSAPRASLEWALLARRLGGGELLQEPLRAEELRPALRRILEVPEGLELSEAAEEPDGPEMVGSGKAMMGIVRGVADLGDSSATVLITGESGTGKELVARALHWASPRREGPFVAINCAAVPETLLESEFFGHEKGAFTGAVTTKLGRFERAEGGTLFLDEVADMDLVLQAKLLRALEEREIERLGGERAIPVDVRVVAATNRRIEERVEAGGFREDLYYRLAVAGLHVPPLRERLEDLSELVVYFVSRFARAYGRPIRGITHEAIRLLSAHDWPGNVRELRNVLDRAVLVSHAGWIRAEDLHVGGDAPALSPGGPGRRGGGYPPNMTLEEVERDHLARVLAFTGGAIAEAAEILGIHRNTLARKLDRYRLRPLDDRE